MGGGGEPMGALHPGPGGRWWGNPELAQKLGITADQRKKMDDILQQHRLTLVDLRATLEKRELTLEPLVSADQPDESKILAEIDQVAQARAELEKANARMLLDVRRVLTLEQWQKLKAESPAPRTAGRGGPPPAPGAPPGAPPQPGR
jgi:Spy/CpxP family protein refolding chaperone